MYEQEVPTEVYRSRRPKRVREHALVLQALGIPFATRQDGGELLIAVPAGMSERASRELAAYQNENRGWPRPDEIPEVLTQELGGVVAWVGTLVVFFLLQTRNALGVTSAAGSVHAASIQDGEWWRAVTSLTLHGDLQHVLSNIVFGALFLGIVAQLLGTGLGLSAVLLSGALGNLLNGWIQAPDFRAIGASTAVFGALGIIGANRWQRRRQHKGRRGTWIPLFAAAALFGWLGTGGDRIDRIDVFGHLCGFLAGLAIGWSFAKWGEGLARSEGAQRAAGVAALAAVIAAWALAA